jgi:membrane protein YdbS with pleckstrin-like domain
VNEIEGDGWRPLPRRARGLFMLVGLAAALPAGLLALLYGAVFELAAPGWVVLVLVAAAAGALLGAWRGERRWRYTRWRLDQAGFSLQRGHLWRSEIRVPQSRVQHLDLRRGPLQRRRGLASLVIHTAGTRHSAVAVSGLDADDAEHLRDVLARQSDDDDDDA